MNIPNIPVSKPFSLPARGSWPEARHIFEQDSALAIRMALAAERPLLVRGEPGTGKSQLARAAAEILGRVFVSEVVHARTEPQDLQWRFDAIARLGEAQRLGSGEQKISKQDPLAPQLFLSPGALWWVFDWHSAEACYKNSRHKLQKPETIEGWKPKQGTVLLIDEIDKADSDLPNSLLETLGNSSFSVPWLDQAIGHDIQTPKPLVIITTNEERELPAAFVRRCLVLNLELPSDEEELIQWLSERGRIHFADEQKYSLAIIEQAAQMVLEDRKTAKDLGMTPPGQAEYLDLLRAVFTMETDTSKQSDLIKEIAKFALKKHAK